MAMSGTSSMGWTACATPVSYTHLLKEAKEFVESAPKTIKEAASKEECEKIKAKLAEVGATVEIK